MPKSPHQRPRNEKGDRYEAARLPSGVLPVHRGGSTPELLLPTPGLLPGSDVTFQWSSNGAPVTKWVLDVGTSPRSSNLHDSGYLAPTVLSRRVTGLPTNGSTIYVRLRYLVSGAWKNTTDEYTAASP